MKWYTAIGCKMEDDEGRLLVKVGGQEKVLTEMEAMLWAALTWSSVRKIKFIPRCTVSYVLHLGKHMQLSGRMKRIFCFA